MANYARIVDGVCVNVAVCDDAQTAAALGYPLEIPVGYWIGDGYDGASWTKAPATPEPAPTLDALRAAKHDEVSAACEDTIHAGVDVTLSDGTTAHFSLTENDQINLTGAVAAIQQGKEAYPYHADGQLCRPYAADDILMIGAAATAHKLYHTTYCNHLFAWIARADADELAGIAYGVQLPDDLAESMTRAMDAART